MSFSSFLLSLISLSKFLISLVIRDNSFSIFCFCFREFLFKKLKSLYNITVIIVAHRLSTVKKADKIIILNNGEIQDQGTYENLKNKKNELFDAMMSSNANI